jgi:hypothetical protein
VDPNFEVSRGQFSFFFSGVQTLVFFRFQFSTFSVARFFSVTGKTFSRIYFHCFAVFILCFGETDLSVVGVLMLFGVNVLKQAL